MTFYEKRLKQYFDQHYSDYKDTVEWYRSPSPNQWRFFIPELSKEIALVCYENGFVLSHVKGE